MNIPEHFQRFFFDRTVRFAKETINKEKSFAEYFKTLTNIHIGVTGDRHILSTPNGQFMVFMAVNLLSRFCQNIDFVIPNDIKTIIKIPFVQENKLAKSLQAWSRKINPFIQTKILEKPKHLYNGTIAVGHCSAQDFGETVFINSDGWLAYINTCENSMRWTSIKYNPIGAFSASCLGVSELFKIVMGRLQHPYKNIGSFTFSTFDYGFSKAPLLNPELPANISLGDLTLVSLGALNSSLLMTLSYIPGIQSTSLTAIEHDNLDITNLNRYPFSFAKDCIIEISKIKSAQNFIESISELKINIPLKRKYEDVAQEIGKINFAVIGVDNIEARWAVQEQNPSVFLCGSTTEKGYVQIHKHEHCSYEEACIRCIYPAALPSSSKAPTISFVSALAGVLLAGEVIKHFVHDFAPFCLDNNLLIRTLEGPYFEKRLLKKLSICPLH